jgi:hypothetical protein
MDEGTGIFIRAEIDGKWQAVDIADPRLPDDQLVQWLRTTPERETAVRVCLMLLGRDQDAVDLVPRG